MMAWTVVGGRGGVAVRVGDGGLRGWRARRKRRRKTAEIEVMKTGYVTGVADFRNSFRRRWVCGEFDGGSRG